MHTTNQVGPYQALASQPNVIRPGSTSIQITEAPETNAPPTAARLQRACCNDPANILGLALGLAIASAAIFGIGTGTGESNYLIAGGAGLAVSLIATATYHLRIPETYTFTTTVGDGRATTVAGIMAAAMSWGFTALVSHTDSSVNPFA